MTPLAETDSRLRETCQLLTRQDLRLKVVQQEIDELLDYAYAKVNKTVGGHKRDRKRPAVVGLSANQVGMMKQICIVDLAIGRHGYTDLSVLINPAIVWRSKATQEKYEGCVNFTTIWGKTSRSKTVRVEALDRSGNEVTIKANGWAAALLQHEIDHINGRLFIDRLVDPTSADLVEAGEYQNYRRAKNDWPTKIDLSDRIVND